jgi:tRNA threonylcarbamoyladenosine biosynthesis protein TsaE
MAIKTFICNQLSDLDRIAGDILTECASMRLFYLSGPMGAGKTTLVKSFCRHLQVNDTVSSPTFAIINEYAGAQESSVYHFDFYRMKNPEEAFDLGYEDYLYSGNYCFIEWPEVVQSLLPLHNAAVIKITASDDIRSIQLEYGL